MGVLKDRVDDARRFAGFVRREAADYHDPPEPPVEAMWAGIETRLGATPVAGVGGDVDHPFDVLGYHDPPPAPREAMWERIETGWAQERPEAPARANGARAPLRLVVARTLGRRPGRTAAWLTGAAAASVALAVAFDRGPQLPAVAEPETIAAEAAREAAPASAAEEPLETSRQFAAVTPPPAADPAPAPTRGRPEADPPVGEAVSSPSQRPVGFPAPSRATADDYDMSRMSRHLDRTQALLVAFRTDIGSDESQRDLARWAREFLVETRSLLNTPAAEGQRERALLQDLELVLVQIARLGPDAPDFERELARESMERQGTLMRLRAASGM